MVLCFTEMDNEEVNRISRGLHALVNKIIGDPVIIDIRRTACALQDNILRREAELRNSDREGIYSGSRAEGLRFSSSDEDWMLVYRYIKVIPSYYSMVAYDSNTTLLLMENEMTKPGFTLLRLIGESANPLVIRTTESFLNGCYLSCKLWRDIHTENWSRFAFTHGPCTGWTWGSLEFDYAYCLRCDIWPTNAHDCIRRLYHCRWPSLDTILSIISDGVIFVPIGAKQSIFENTEWRMSFSLAEKKLIHAMNHTQFLCYGLLKIFLKEAIDVNEDTKGLLCSYFLKTVLFWEITKSSNDWNPSSLLSCFWKCFLRLLQWITCSYCPNFFIPQNNMFAGKIEGTNRDKLLQHLRTLYFEGYRSILRCPSLPYRMYMSGVVLSPIPSNSWIALNIIYESYSRTGYSLHAPTHSIKDRVNMRCLLLHQCATATNNRLQLFILRIWLSGFLTSICMNNHHNNSTEGRCSNRSYYGGIRGRLNVLKMFAVDSVTHILYKTMLCYKAEMYNQALRLVQLSKEKISAPNTIYFFGKITETLFKTDRWRQSSYNNHAEEEHLI